MTPLRVAIQDSWPNLPENAEREFIKRFIIACGNVGVECQEVVTSDDIIACDPAAVLVSHEFSRKLTSVPTIGAIWSPLSFFRDDDYRLRSLMSYDGFLAGNSAIRTFLSDLQFGLTATKPISREPFLPTTYMTPHLALQTVEKPTLSYVGVHWDGTRHRDLFAELVRRKLITCYGPERSWQHVGGAYGGYLPFDGKAVLDTIASHGIALCLHKAEHRSENTPSMRLFEALSVGALPICDEIAFARDHLADFVEFIDINQSAITVANRIEQIIDDTRRSPGRAIERAVKAKAWFDKNWSLEHKITTSLIPLIEEVRAVGRFDSPAPSKTARSSVARATPAEPACEVVVRSGGRDLQYLKRTIDSIKAASAPEFPVGVVLVDYKGRQELVNLATEMAAPDFPIRYLRSPNTGFRSTALWDGIKAVKAPFVAHMDDDDTVFPNHYRQLAEGFRKNNGVKVFYSGVIKVEDEAGFYSNSPNFDGPTDKVIEERRELTFLSPFNLRRLVKFDNFIQSNTWMAERVFIQSRIGDDPELVVVEDVFLYLLLASDGPFGFTGSPTAQWHWRSHTNDNSMRAVEQTVWQDCVARSKFRLANIPFRSALTFDELLNPPVSGSAVRAEVVDERAPESLSPLNFNHAIEGGLDFKAKTILSGFHEPEIGGIWSSAHSASVLFTLGSQVREQGGTLIVECLGSMTDVVDRWIELGIEGQEHQRLKITDWSIKSVEFVLPPVSASPVVLKLTSSHLIEPAQNSKERRQLGGFLKTIRVVASSEPAAALSGPPGRSMLIRRGMGVGLIDQQSRSNLLLRCPIPGSLLVLAQEGGLTLLPSNDQGFVISRRLAQLASGFVFLAADRRADGVAHLQPTELDPRLAEPSLKVERAASLREYDTSGGRAHMAAVFSRGAFGHMDDVGYLLISIDQQKVSWKVRPFFGAAWDLLFNEGEGGEDGLSAYREGFLPAAFGLADPSAGLDQLSSIARAVLVGAVSCLIHNEIGEAGDFLSSLVRKLSLIA